MNKEKYWPPLIIAAFVLFLAGTAMADDIVSPELALGVLASTAVSLFYFTIALFMFCTFLFTPNRRGLLWAALYSASMCIAVVLNTPDFEGILSGWSNFLYYRLSYMTISLAVIFFNHFVRNESPQSWSKRRLYATDFIAAAFGIGFLFLEFQGHLLYLRYEMTMLVVWQIALLVGLIRLFWYTENREERQRIGILVLVTVLFAINPVDCLLDVFGFDCRVPYSDYTDVVMVLLMVFYFAYRMAAEYKRGDSLEAKNIAAETAFLHTQIKPHFLYNTLNALIALCYMDGERAGKLLADFSSFLRQSLSVECNQLYTTIAKELELTKLYVSIEETRFGNAFRTEFDIPDELLEKNIIHYSLQPLVENAVLHGARRNPDGGLVKISMCQTAAGIAVKVIDNGPGINPQIAAQMISGDYKGGVGMSNVIKRLKLIYGQVLQIEGTSQGTTLGFLIPESKT